MKMLTCVPCVTEVARSHTSVTPRTVSWCTWGSAPETPGLCVLRPIHRVTNRRSSRCFPVRHYLYEVVLGFDYTELET